MTTLYELARKKYAEIGVNTDEAIEYLLKLPISMHCWQGDDVTGFEGGGALSGGIVVSGGAPGKARSPEELTDDISEAFSLIPGKHRLNLHASYAIFDNGTADRDALLPEHFSKWVEFAKKKGIGLDFNPTFFSHVRSENGTLSSENEENRAFWIRHGQACLKISEYFANELNSPSTMNIWIPDGFKEIPADRTGPRARLKDSLDKIIQIPYDRAKVNIAVESKVFGIGLESHTVGSHEFYMLYAARNNLLCLLDNGHYHPTENVADKIPSMLLFADKVALHLTRGVRWDSDHVPLYDDELRDIAREIVLAGARRVIIATDFFDAGINRIAAWVMGMRNVQKALLSALLTPHDILMKCQNKRDFTGMTALREEYKLYPVGAVWDELCERAGVPGADWLEKVRAYEKEVLSKR